MDIDNCGLKDPLNVVEYIDDIYAHYRKTEVYFISYRKHTLCYLYYTNYST